MKNKKDQWKEKERPNLRERWSPADKSQGEIHEMREMRMLGMGSLEESADSVSLESVDSGRSGLSGKMVYVFEFF